MMRATMMKAATAQKGVAKMPQAGGANHGRGLTSSTAAAVPMRPDVASATGAAITTTGHCAWRDPGEPHEEPPGAQA
eukprot:5078239-Heterocapsa_arctica.AAC.1